MTQCDSVPDVVHAVDINGQNISSIGSPDVGNILFDPSAELHPNVSAVHFEPAENRQSQTSRQTVIRDDDSLHLGLIL